MLSRAHRPGFNEGSRMVAKKVHYQGAASLIQPGPKDAKCPQCGALESAGGCEDPVECVRAVAKAEAEYATEVTNLFDHPKSRFLPLFMAGFEALDLLNIGLVVTSASGSLLMA